MEDGPARRRRTTGRSARHSTWPPVLAALPVLGPGQAPGLTRPPLVAVAAAAITKPEAFRERAAQMLLLCWHQRGRWLLTAALRAGVRGEQGRAPGGAGSGPRRHAGRPGPLMVPATPRLLDGVFARP